MKYALRASAEVIYLERLSIFHTETYDYRGAEPRCWSVKRKCHGWSIYFMVVIKMAFRVRKMPRRSVGVCDDVIRGIIGKSLGTEIRAQNDLKAAKS